MKRGSGFSFHVTVVIAAIAFIYFSTVFVFIDQWFGLWSSPGMLNAVFFTVVAVMCISNYALAIYTDPGQVPSSFVPDVEDPDNIVHEIKRKVLLAGSITINSPKDDQQSEGSFRVVYIISGLILVPLSLALGFFLCWHFYLILQNKTTIEYQEGVRAMCVAEKGGYVYSHPYDLGAYENLIAVLGPNVLCWLLPSTKHIDSGLRFRTSFDNKFRQQSRSLCIVSGSGSDESNSQDDEVDNLGVKAALSMLKFYKREISPIMPKSCRYIPTCSEYSMIAYKKYGVVKGTVLTAWRLCRCNPLGGSGFDPPRWFDEESPPQE
uniref:Membrane protein insertion efficiency factor n=1 Tax=Solanum lycopersicum TaxID=4081 RepID=A0A3Q7IMB6_SOLLC